MEASRLLHFLFKKGSLLCDYTFSMERVLYSAIAQSLWKGFFLVPLHTLIGKGFSLVLLHILLERGSSYCNFTIFLE